MPRPLVQKGAKWRQEYKEALKVSKCEKEEYKLWLDARRSCSARQI